MDVIVVILAYVLFLVIAAASLATVGAWAWLSLPDSTRQWSSHRVSRLGPLRPGVPIVALVAFWGSVALVVSLSEFWPPPPAGVGLWIIGCVGVMSLATFAIPAMRRSAAAVPIEALIGLHGIRVFGVLFLVYSGAGLASQWAIPAGWADIGVAVLAIPAALAARRRIAWVWLWNIVGFVDIIAAPAMGVWFATQITDSMHGMRELPLSFVPLFLNPLMVYLHIVITWRLLRNDIYTQNNKEYQDDNPAENRLERQNNAVYHP